MNISQIALTREQMKELQQLGLDCSDASLCWTKEPNEDEYRLFLHDEFCYEAACLYPVPAYTLEDIILKINAAIDYNKKAATWQCSYIHLISWEEIKAFRGITLGKTPMEAAFHALKEVIKCVPDKIRRLR